MSIPNIWGQGQLFAFSALDGRSLFSDDLVGSLCGDKIGVRFHTKTRRELAFTGIRGFFPTFKAVTSDLITLTAPGGDMNILYAESHLIVGNTLSPVSITVLVEGEWQSETIGECKIQNTADGEFTALLKRGDKFAFAYGHSAKEAAELAEKGISLDIFALIEKRLSLYRKFSLGDNKYAMLYGKCISVMKSQLYSPEEKYSRIWSTPDRLPHKHLWLWDSVFHAIGHRNIDTSLAEDLILGIFDGQDSDGFIPHMASVGYTSEITQPPVIAWGSLIVFEKSGNKEFLKSVFEHNKSFLDWCSKNRRQSDRQLYTWLTKNDVVCRCDECGMDNSPRFDKLTYLEAIDFCCFMANEARAMSKMAEILGLCEEKEFYDKWFEEIKADVNEKLWSEEDGFYFDYDILDKKLHKVWSVASFLPLFAGICDEHRAKRLLNHLLDPETFYSTFPIPSISKKDPTYGTDMWRGPVWLNYNYMLIEGLIRYGFTEFAEEVRSKTFEVLNKWYLKTGTLFEFYDPEDASAPSCLNRKGIPFEPYDFSIRYQAIRDYGWTHTLLFDMLHNKFN